MPDREINVLYQEIKNTRSGSEHYKAFLEAMESLNTEMTELMEADETSWKLLDKNRFASLAEKYRKAGGRLEVYLSRTAETKDPAEIALREKVARLGELLSADTAALRQYRPRTQRELKSLPTLIEEARIPVMDQGSRHLKHVSGAQSSRFPMTIIDANGNPVPGMFTKAEVFDPMGVYNRAAGKVSSLAATPEGADLLRNFMTLYKAYYTQHPDPAKPVNDDPNMIYRFLMSSRSGTGSTNLKVSPDKFAEELARVSGKTAEEVKRICGKNALKNICSDLSSSFFDIYIKTYEVGMTNKTRVDRKNAGMSIVAELLGMPHIVPQAKPMKLKGPDGRIVDGTFMAFAEGVDPIHPGRAGMKLNGYSLENTDGRGLEAISDLQVLDYICGNVDRHGYNVFYLADEDGKLIGVQGIDNDSSFGIHVPQTSQERVRRLVTPSAMGVISKQTADRILQLSTAELAFALRGTVDEPSIQAACTRLIVMQKNIERSREKLDPNKKDIQYPYIRELETKDFARVDLKKLTDKTRNNHFREFNSVIKGIAGRSRPGDEPDDPKLIGGTNRATEAGVTGQILKAKAFSKKLSDLTSFWRGSSSQNYQDLEQAVKDYQALQEKIRDRMALMKKRAAKGNGAPETLYGQYVTGFDMNEMRKSLEVLKAAADNYADTKTQEVTAAGKSLEDDKYIRLRVEAAREISRFAEEGMKITPEEHEALASNDRRATEQYARIQTAAEYKKGKEKEQEEPVIRKGPGRESLLQP